MAKIIGFRDHIVRDYFNINLEIVWEIVQKKTCRFQIKAFKNPRS